MQWGIVIPKEFQNQRGERGDDGEQPVKPVYFRDRVITENPQTRENDPDLVGNDECDEEQHHIKELAELKVDFLLAAQHDQKQ